MSVTAGTVPPPVSWAQTQALVYVIIDVECSDIEQKVTEKTFTFKGINLLDPSKKYEVTLNFYCEVDPEKVTTKNIGRCLEFTIHKKETGPYWPALTSDKTRLHFLKPNFAKWTDESDDENSPMDTPNFDFMDMRRNVSGGDLDDLEVYDDEDDSDDNIPSLVQNDEDDDEDGADNKKENKAN